MWRVYGGAIMVIAGIAAFIEAHSNHPIAAYALPAEPIKRLRYADAGITASPASGLSPDAYDLLRIGAWALVILGALTIILELIRYTRAR